MSADTGPIRILSVDDHPVFRKGIVTILAGESDMSLVAEASNGREAIQQFRAHRPDVTLMDLQMPVMGWPGCDDRDSRRISRGARYRAHHLHR